MATPIKIYWIKTRETEFSRVKSSSLNITTSPVTSKKKATYDSWLAHSTDDDGVKSNGKTQQDPNTMEYYRTVASTWYTGIKAKSTTVTTKNKRTGKKTSKKVWSYSATKNYCAKWAKDTKAWQSNANAFSLSEFQPSSINITYQDLDIEDDNVGTDVGRDRTTGYIKRHRVRSNVRTIEVTFPPMEQGKLSRLLNALSDASNPTGNNGYLKIKHDDPLTNSAKETVFYAGDRQMEALHNGWWGEMKVTFVEV